MFDNLPDQSGPGWTLHHAECVERMNTMPENSIDAILTDPPYHLTSIKARDGTNETRARNHSDAMARLAGGFMGKAWDGGDVAFRVETWQAAYRVLKPGGYLMAFASSRGYHRMAVAIEDAGFITHPMIGWVFGSGFPKATDASKMIDKAEDYKLQAAHRRAWVEAVQEAGLFLPNNSRHDWTIGEHAPGNKWWAEFEAWLPGLSGEKREAIERIVVGKGFKPRPTFHTADIGGKADSNEYDIHAPATPEAAAWQGWYYGGQVRKPALEPICVAQKPFSEKNGALNILKWGVGAVNIDGCRVETADTVTNHSRSSGAAMSKGIYGDSSEQSTHQTEGQALGRWPANLIHDGSPEVLGLFPVLKARSNRNDSAGKGATPDQVYAGGWGDHDCGVRYNRDDPDMREGSAARFFECYPITYHPKANARDRLGSRHPTVKPMALMRSFVRHVCPPGGVVLDPFAGTGTTLRAAVLEDRRAIGIEADAASVVDTVWRMRHAQSE